MVRHKSAYKKSHADDEDNETNCSNDDASYPTLKT